MPSNTKVLFPEDSSNVKNLEEKVIKKELFEESLKTNMLRAFVMPIFKELNNISIFPLWKQIQNNIPIDAK